MAVVGASNDRRKFGNKALRAFQAEGYRVIPINPNEREVEGIATYASVLDVPERIDMATVYVQPEVAVRLLSDFGEKNIPEQQPSLIGEYVKEVQRVETARRLLEETSDGLEAVCARSGLGTTESMRRTFIRLLGAPPSRYRERFSRQSERFSRQRTFNLAK